MNIPQPVRDAAINLWVGLCAVGRTIRDGWLALTPETRKLIVAFALGAAIGVALCVATRAKG